MAKQRTSWLSRLNAKLFKENEPPPSLIVEEGGFSYVQRDRETIVRWSDVKEIFAFKRDIFSYDLICVGFRVSDDGTYWEIDEQMHGYEEVLAALDKAFPEVATRWWQKVAFPAFETNFLTLWGDPKQQEILKLPSSPKS